MMRIVIFLGACLLGASTLLSVESQTPAQSALPADGDEFVGPFPSWSNVKTTYGAIGDGVTDDTKAIQRALDELGTSDSRSPVLYFPAGTYRITGTLTLSFRIHVSVVGEDPDRTTIAWDGAPAGTMLVINGVAYSRVARFTFNGNRRASVAVEQSWDGTRPHFDTGNEYVDAQFIDVEYGIHGGFKDRGFAETSIRRARFLRNSKAGIALGNFNALDIWIWSSLFEDCAIGVTNDPGAGNYHVYQSVFRRSTIADLYMKNTGGFSIRDNFSSDSEAFLVSPAISHPATVDIQRNTIVAPRDPNPIRLGNQGPALLLDNTIVGAANATGPAVSWRSLFGSDVVSVGNTFTVENPLSVSGRLVAVDDRVVSPSTLSPAEPALPGPWRSLNRMVVEVPRDANAATIQGAIDTAVQNGRRSIVHLPFGSYAIDRTLMIPPSDVQLVGDTMSTILRWTGGRAGPVIRIGGPSQVTLRDLQVQGNAIVDGIALEHVDQPGSRISLNGVEFREAEKHSLLVEGVDNVELQLVDVGHALSKGPSFSLKSGRVTVFSGASSNNWLSYEVTGGARALVRDIWYEGQAAGGFAKVHGRAHFTMQGARVAAPGTHPPSFEIADLNGSATLLTISLDDRIVLSGASDLANLLGLGILRDPQSPSYFSSTSAPGFRALLINGRQQLGAGSLLNPGSRLVADIGAMDADFIRSMLKDTRAAPAPTLNALTPDRSDVRMFRVWIARALTNLSVTSGSR